MKLLVTCIIFLLVTSLLNAQTSPPNNAAQQSNGVPLVWQPYSTVTVYINGTYYPPDSAMEAAVKQGFINNQNAYYAHDGVTYTFLNVGFTPTLTQNTVFVTASPLQTPSASNGYVGKWEDAQWNPPTFNSVYGEDFMTSGTLTVNSALLQGGAYQSADGVTYASSHGDSHYDGLGDCPACPAGTTVMSYNNSFPTPSITGPQPADVNVNANPTGSCQADPCSCYPSGPGCNPDSGDDGSSSGGDCEAVLGGGLVRPEDCSADCSNVCDTSCTNYDYCSCYPSDPSCSGECEGVCDPSCYDYDPYECDPFCYECDLGDCDDAVPAGATPDIKAHPMCDNDKPLQRPWLPSAPVIAALSQFEGAGYAKNCA